MFCFYSHFPAEECSCPACKGFMARKLVASKQEATGFWTVNHGCLEKPPEGFYASDCCAVCGNYSGWGVEYCDEHDG